MAYFVGIGGERSRRNKGTEREGQRADDDKAHTLKCFKETARLIQLQDTP
jgi:hypothetical protein